MLMASVEHHDGQAQGLGRARDGAECFARTLRRGTRGGVFRNAELELREVEEVHMDVAAFEFERRLGLGEVCAGADGAETTVAQFAYGVKNALRPVVAGVVVGE